MCSTHEIYCKSCGKKLAWWSMFDNVQYADEYQCSSAIKNKTNRIIMDDVIQDDTHLKKLDNILKKHAIKGKDWSYCHNLNHTVFCERCASDLDYKCTICGGKIILKRRV